MGWTCPAPTRRGSPDVLVSRPKLRLLVVVHCHREDRLDEDTIDYFRSLSEESGIPYQSLINSYLRDCAAEKKTLRLEWAS